MHSSTNTERASSALRPLSRGRPTRAVIEPLEQRIILAVNTWISPLSGAWTVPTNWSDGIPTPDDDVTIDPAGALTITIGNGAQAVNSISVPGDDTLAITGGTLTIGGASFVSQLAMSGGTLTANGQLKLTGSSSWASGTIAGSLRNEGTLAITGFGGTFQSATLSNAGTITQGTAVQTFTGNSRVNNLAGGIYEFTANNFGALNGGAGDLFQNEGIIRNSVPAGSGARWGSLPLLNKAGGEFEVLSGTLELNTTGTLEGAFFDVRPDAVFRFNGAALTVAGTLTGNGGGVVRLENSPSRLTGAVGAVLNFPEGMFLFRAEATLSGEFTNTGFLQINDGAPKADALTLNNSGTIKHGNTPLTLTNNSRVNNFTGGTYEFTTSGFGAFSGATGNLFVNEGIIRLNVPGINGTRWGSLPLLNKASGKFEVLGGILQLNTSGTLEGGFFDVRSGGNVSFTGTSLMVTGTLTGGGGGGVRLEDGDARLTGAPGAVLNFPDGMFLFRGGATMSGTFTNAGFIRLNDNAENLDALTLNNAGTIIQIDANPATLTSNSRINNLAGGIYEFRVNTFNALNGGAGNLFHNEGLIRGSVPAGSGAGWGSLLLDNVGTVEVVSGGLQLDGPVAQFSSGPLTGGTWIARGGTLRLSGGAAITSNAGTINLAGGGFTGLDALTSNSGTLQLSNGADATFANAITNTGALVLGPGSVFTAPGFIQTSGGTQLSGGAIQTNSELAFNGGQLSGSGMITGKVVNNGATVLPGSTASGVLTITGDYTQNASGTLQINIGGTVPGTQHDQLAVSGTASLGGMLAVNLINGYSPSLSDVFKIVVAGTRTGTFASAPTALTPSYTPTEVRLAIGTTPSISINDVSIREGNSSDDDLTFRVTLSGPSTQTVIVQFATANGTATAPDDYTARPLTTLTFLPGEISKIIDVLVLGDLVGEGDETLFVNLSNPVNATLADSQGQGTVVNDDGGPTLSVNKVSIAEGNTGTTTAIFTVGLSVPSSLPVTVQYATTDGTALAGEDYTALPLLTLTFAPGETSQLVPVTISGDLLVEPTEYFALSLSNPTNAAIASGFGAGSIRNDDFDQLSSGKLKFPEPDGDVVTVILKGATIGSSTVTLGEDGSIELIDLTQFANAQHARGGKPLSLKVAVAKAGSGDGFTKVGRIDASGLGLGKVNLQGDLGEIAAGNGTGKAALKSLTISRDFGLAERAGRLSEILGSIGKLKVEGSVQKGSMQVEGKIKVVDITRDLVGELESVSGALDSIATVGISGFLEGGNPVSSGMLLAEEIGKLRVGGSVKSGAVVTGKNLGAFSLLGDFLGGGLFSEGGMKKVKVAGTLMSEDPSTPVSITAKDRLASLVIGGDVVNASILAGYNKSESPVSADGQIGKVIVKGNWTASSLVAGIQDATADGFGRNDSIISGDSTPSVPSRIAKVVIKGTASGSAAAGDHFGITAQEVGRLSIGGAAIALSKGEPDDILLDDANGDFRVVEFA